jgi:hypothetical protein
MSPQNLIRILRSLGCTRLLAKRLAPNDNSKNQIYLGGDYKSLNLIPFGYLKEDSKSQANSKRTRLKAALDLAWIDKEGNFEDSHGANLILYPKYPEVRLSGMLVRLRNRGPSSVIARREPNRWLFLGISGTGKIYCHAENPDGELATWAEDLSKACEKHGVFFELPITAGERHEQISERLYQIASAGWIRSRRLDAKGNSLPCESENCGGYTLEAELGIRPNGRADPDFHGWEIKQFAVRDLENPVGAAITLFTPEPDGGVYKEAGVVTFLQTYGYRNDRVTHERVDFGGIHKCGERQPKTGLTLEIRGWDLSAGKLESTDGGIHLVDDNGVSASIWSFTSLMNHWKRKHCQAVYVPSMQQPEPRAYRYGFKVLMGKETDFSLVVKALSQKWVYYDPGIKMETEDGRSTCKRRSQFRVNFRHLRSLYNTTEWRDLRVIVQPRQARSK